MATADFISATVLPSGRDIALVFRLTTSTWAGTITESLAGGDAVEIVLPDGQTRNIVSLVSTEITSSNRLLTVIFALSSPIRRDQEIDALLIAEDLFTDTSGDKTPSVVTSSVTNNSMLSASGSRTRGLGRMGIRGRM